MKNNNNELIDYMINDFKSGIKHGVLVANLTYELAQMCGLSKDEAYELKILCDGSRCWKVKAFRISVWKNR